MAAAQIPRPPPPTGAGYSTGATRSRELRHLAGKPLQNGRTARSAWTRVDFSWTTCAKVVTWFGLTLPGAEARPEAPAGAGGAAPTSIRERACELTGAGVEGLCTRCGRRHARAAPSCHARFICAPVSSHAAATQPCQRRGFPHLPPLATACLAKKTCVSRSRACSPNSIPHVQHAPLTTRVRAVRRDSLVAAGGFEISCESFGDHRWSDGVQGCHEQGSDAGAAG